MMIEQTERHLAELRARRATIGAELETLAPELERAEAILLEASAIFDAALGERLALEQEGGPPLRLTPQPGGSDAMHLPSEGETWMPQRRVGVEQERRLTERRAAALGVWQQADAELAAARVRYNAASVRRSGLLMDGRQLDDAIARTEAELERAQREHVEPRDLLASIRERLGLGGAA